MEGTQRAPGDRAGARVLAAALALAGVALLVAAACATPWGLERFVLADGDAGGGAVRGLYLGTAALLAGAGVALLAAARQRLRRPRALPLRALLLPLLASGIGLVVALVLAEIVVRVVYDPQDLLDGDAFWIHRFAASHEDGSFHSEYPMDRYDPALGWVPAEGYRSERVRVNALGLRGPELAREKPRGERRVLAVGDSFTFGEGVADADTWPARLERTLGGPRVANLGVLGYGLDQQLLRLRQTGLALDPDVVVLAPFDDDLDRVLLAFRDYAKPRFRLEGGALRLTHVPVPPPEEVLEVFPPRLPRLLLPPLVRRGVRPLVERTRFAEKWRLSEALLDEASALLDARGVPLLLVHLPLKRPSFKDWPTTGESVLRRWAARRGVPFVAMRETFAALPRADQQRVYHGHYTPFGNRVVAERIARALRAHGLVQGG